MVLCCRVVARLWSAYTVNLTFVVLAGDITSMVHVWQSKYECRSFIGEVESSEYETQIGDDSISRTDRPDN